jgi:hypothetical protein
VITRALVATVLLVGCGSASPPATTTTTTTEGQTLTGNISATDCGGYGIENAKIEVRNESGEFLGFGTSGVDEDFDYDKPLARCDAARGRRPPRRCAIQTDHHRRYGQDNPWRVDLFVRGTRG